MRAISNKKKEKQRQEKELNQMSANICQELIEEYKKGELYEYIDENALDIVKDEDGDITRIVFTIGGPYVHLDLYGDNFGCVVSEEIDALFKAAIPMPLWLEIRSELEDYYE